MTVPLLARVKLAAASGLSEDAVLKDFAFLAADSTSGTLDGIGDSIAELYNTIPSGATFRLSAFIGDQVARGTNVHTVSFYDLTGHLDGSPTGSPIGVRPFDFTGGASGDNWPGEVAVKITFYADGWEDVAETAVNPSPPPATIRPRARYRGGIFLGPVTSATAVESGGIVRPTDTDFIDTLDGAFFAFQDERADWAVWSRMDEDLKLIAPGGLVTYDNAYDTIRHRGVAPTSRHQIWP